MPLAAGARLGPYEIVAPIGAGGMGEVWKARDTRLGRDVAIKLCKEHFSERFEREARAVAALNHPNICTLFDVGPDYLVMEFIDGMTLAERIAQGPLPLDEALGIARQIADALEAAHDRNIVHRDLKPVNIKIRPDGSVKVLDFGLARAGEAQEVTGDSPTMVTVGTQAGIILGTAGYMSPEQARGQAVDRRADIWAFGVVLYEMLTGNRLFDGETVSDSLAAILTKEPDLMPAPEKTRRLLQRCLEKDPRKRLRGIGDWQELLQGQGQTAPSPSRLGTIGWVAAGVFAAMAVAVSALHFREPELPEMRLDIVTPPTTAPGSFALSPDGKKIAYVASGDGPQRLWVRSLDSTSAQALPGTDGAFAPFWSPEGRSLGFFRGGDLKRVDIGGGQPNTLSARTGAGTGAGTWNSEGVIVFLGDGGVLVRVSASGGQAAVLTMSGRVPRFLPDGKRFLFNSQRTSPAIWLGALDGSAPLRIANITGTDSSAEYLAPGWLVRVHQAVLVAQRFDSGKGRLMGDPVPLAFGVGGVDPTSNPGPFSVAASGTIAWRNVAATRRQLKWFDRSGQNTGTLGAPDDSVLSYPEIAPDGNRVAFTRGSLGVGDLWVQEGTRTSRFTFDPADDRIGIWSPDGTKIVFLSGRKGTDDLYLKPADGSGSEEVLLESADSKRPGSWSPDGKFILYDSLENGGDIMVLPLSGDRKPYPFLSTPFAERMAAFSPDGKWVAYQSDESGRPEIYVRPFPGPGGKWQVSVDGGTQARWRGDGKELYFVTGDGKLMAAPVGTQGSTFVPGTPGFLFQTHMPLAAIRQQYDVARDGRFLVNTELESAATEPIHVLLNWKPPK